jgi:SPP1 family predicted phage head-tail adaptor
VLTTDELAAMRATQTAAMPDEVIVERPVREADGYGSATVTWDEVATVAGRAVTSGGAETVADARVAVPRTWRITLPHDTDIAVGDRAVIGDITVDITSVQTAGAWSTATIATGAEHA